MIHHQSLASPLPSLVSIVFCASSCLSPLFQSLQNLVASLFPQQSKTRRWCCWRNTLRRRWCWAVVWWSTQLPIPHSIVNADCSQVLSMGSHPIHYELMHPRWSYGDAIQIWTRCAHVPPPSSFTSSFLTMECTRWNAHDGMHTM